MTACCSAQDFAALEKACASLADAEAAALSALGETHEERRDEVHRRWAELADMTEVDLVTWSSTPLSRVSTTDPAGALERSLRLVRKRHEDWDERDVADAGRAISFITRMQGAPDGDPIPGALYTPREIALRNWGHAGKRRQGSLATLAAKPDDTLDAAIAAQRYVDRVADAGLPGLATALQAPIDAVLAEVRAAKDYDDLERRLPKLAEALGREARGSDFQAIVEAGLQMGLAAGVWAVTEEVG